jgi:23S rRNA (adenine2030-N6)-methyltransferase
VAGFNSKPGQCVYPGSPFIIQRLLRDRDKLKLFELHPTDAKTLSANIAQLDVGRQVAVLREDGFEGLKNFLPPPARRALRSCDPSYEIKSDYARVPAMAADAGPLRHRHLHGSGTCRFRARKRTMCRGKLKTLAMKAQRPWLVQQPDGEIEQVDHGRRRAMCNGQACLASGVFIINPPHTLKAALQAALPQLVAKLAQDSHAAWAVDQGG